MDRCMCIYVCVCGPVLCVCVKNQAYMDVCVCMWADMCETYMQLMLLSCFVLKLEM